MSFFTNLLKRTETTIHIYSHNDIVLVHVIPKNLYSRFMLGLCVFAFPHKYGVYSTLQKEHFNEYVQD